MSMAQDSSIEATGHRRPRRDGAVWALIMLHLALALALSFIMLLGYAPDEPRHLAYVRWLATTGTFPPADESISGGAHHLHPPLYYTLMLPVWWLLHGMGEDAVMRGMRCLSPLFGAAALWLLVPVLRRAAGASRGLFLFMLALVALWPNLILCVAMANNDAASVLMAALLLHVVLARRWDARPSSAALWGAALGMAALAKFSNFIAGAGVVGMALVLVHGRAFFRREGFYRGALLVAVCCLAVCGWWWYRNLLLHGALNPYPLVPIRPEGVTVAEWALYGYAWPYLWRAIHGLWSTTWPILDWIPPATVPIVLWVLRALTATAVVGAVVLVARLRRGTRAMGEAQVPAVLVPAAGYALMLAALIWVAVFGHMGTYRMGRYLAPFIVGLVIPMSLSLRETIPPRARVPLALALLLFFLAFNVASWYHLLTYWNPLVAGGG